jgi:hypothetical protein
MPRLDSTRDQGRFADPEETPRATSTWLQSSAMAMRLLTLGLLLAASVHAQDPRIDLRLLSLEDGLPDNLEKSTVFKTARSAGVDLRQPSHPIIVASYRDGRLFHLFYKSTENALGDRPYLIQRLKRILRSWKSADAEPEETVEYKVEAFKTIAGALKRPDAHWGSYGLGEYRRREVIKEYEIGFGEIPGVCEGELWPYDKKTLFKMLQDWSRDPGLHDKVSFSRARMWRLEVSFDASGSYRVRSPELGFDIHARLPGEEATRPRPDQDSRGTVLLEVRGLEGVVLVVAALGEPLERVKSRSGNTNLSFRASLTVNLTPDGKVNTVFTRAGFAGRTAKGASHESTRAEIRKLYGDPKRGEPDSDFWLFDGVAFWFDGFDRVRRITIHGK